RREWIPSSRCAASEPIALSRRAYLTTEAPTAFWPQNKRSKRNKKFRLFRLFCGQGFVVVIVSNGAGELVWPDALLDAEGDDQRRVLHECADLAAPSLAPVVRAFLGGFGRTRNPPRRRWFVREILGAEDRLEHAFLVRDDERVLDRKDQDCHRQEPRDAGD